jgi:peptide-methionine (S)-S-oxide reductase
MQPHSGDIATLAGGCFWCLESPFHQLSGVNAVVSGYMGGHVPDPDYKAVCTGGTGHAEVIQVHFDPTQIAFTDLLEVFFTLHDPTTRNRQGNDMGTQYRSAVFYHTEQQRMDAEAVMARFNADQVWPAPIVTELVPATTFYPAEDYHQRYFERNPSQPYCMAVIGPKLAKLRARFSKHLKHADSATDVARKSGP